MVRTLTALAVALVLAAAGALGLSGQDAPRQDLQQQVAPLVLPAAVDSGTTDLAPTIDSLKATLERVPEDSSTWATLGLAYIEQVRVTGDTALYAKADDAVARSFAVQPEENARAHAAAAALAAARHEFQLALDETERALAIDPYQSQALAVRVDALTELGRYREQLRALRLADRRRPGLSVVTRYSYAYELRGDLRRAADVLRPSLQTTSPGDRAYVATLMAGLARSAGQLDRSAELLRMAAQASPGYVEAVVGRAQLAAARGDLDRALVLWRDVVRRAPSPDHHLELGELYLTLGQEDLAREQLGIVTDAYRALEADGVLGSLETALFEAEHGSPSVALEAARTEWSRNRNIDAANALGWALHRTGASQEGLRYARLATRLGTPHPDLWIHRGLIEAAVDRTDEARKHLRAGLAMDGGEHTWLRAQAATTLARLGS